MNCVSDKNSHGRKRPIAVASALLVAIAMIIGTADLAAQGIPEFSRAFLGNWIRDNSFSRGDCGEGTPNALIDQNGLPRANCAIPVSQLPLTARAHAWIKYFDELQSPLYECAAHGLPNILGDVRPWNLSTKIDRVVINYEMGNQTRIIWLNGVHPPPTDLFYYGHSLGRWEDNALIVETTNFTFDPDGMDDHAHLPTSVRKKVTERYEMTGKDTAKVTITLEDPLFLTKPFTYVHHLKRYTQPLDGWSECDPEVTRREIELTVPDKYVDK